MSVFSVSDYDEGSIKMFICMLQVNMFRCVRFLYYYMWQRVRVLVKLLFYQSVNRIVAVPQVSIIHGAYLKFLKPSVGIFVFRMLTYQARCWTCHSGSRTVTFPYSTISMAASTTSTVEWVPTIFSLKKNPNVTKLFPSQLVVLFHKHWLAYRLCTMSQCCSLSATRCHLQSVRLATNTHVAKGHASWPMSDAFRLLCLRFVKAP